jgi:hypothetical protein
MSPHERQTWREVSETEFLAWLAARPQLQARPSITVKHVNHREWSELSRGPWPDNVVGKMTRRPKGKGMCCQIRLFP